MMKIGLVQRCAVAGDLSQNLRQIVQGYRECINAGAEVVVTSAQALDGAFLYDLAERSSLRLQAMAALESLANETSLPLILASHAGLPNTPPTGPEPWLLHKGKVRRLRNHSTFSIRGEKLFIDVGATPDTAHQKADYVLHLPCSRWWLGQQAEWSERIAREARETGATVLLLRAVAYGEGEMMIGGSMVTSPGDDMPRQLPLYEAAAYVWRGQAHRASAPHPPRIMDTLCFGLRQAWLSGGYDALGVCEESPRAALLLALARLSVGVRHTVALGQERLPVCALAGKRLTPTPGIFDRILPLSDISLTERLLNLRNPGAIAGAAAPLGELRESELAALHADVRSQLPPALQQLLPDYRPCISPQQEEELRLLAEENASPTEILHRFPHIQEASLRHMQRKLSNAAAHRYGHPCSLRVRRSIAHLPAHHRLKE